MPIDTGFLDQLSGSIARSLGGWSSPASKPAGYLDVLSRGLRPQGPRLLDFLTSWPRAQAPQQAPQAPANILASTPVSQPAPEAPGPAYVVPAPAPEAPAPDGDYVAYARAAAQRAGLNPDIFERQIRQESGFNPRAKSPAGASGIAQIMPVYHDPQEAFVWDPYKSLDYAANLMSSHLSRYNGSYARALAAYNAGPGNVDSGDAFGFAETLRYLDAVLGPDWRDLYWSQEIAD